MRDDERLREPVYGLTITLWMHEGEAGYWRDEAERMGTTVDQLIHLCALGNLSYQLRRRGHDVAICAEFDALIAGWAGALGWDVVPRDGADPTSRQTFAPHRQEVDAGEHTDRRPTTDD